MRLEGPHHVPAVVLSPEPKDYVDVAALPNCFDWRNHPDGNNYCTKDLNQHIVSAGARPRPRVPNGGGGLTEEAPSPATAARAGPTAR